MKKHTLVILFLVGTVSVFAQKKIVVMGSSTAAGSGASHPDSSWVGRFQKFYRQNTNPADPDTQVINIAGYGQTSYHQMPTGWVSPVANRPSIDPNHNVTKALSFSPDIVIINLPSNDVANLYWPGSVPLYTTSETMNNFRTMDQTIRASGAKVFFTTTQPRNDIEFEKRQLLRNLVDSIKNTFGNRAIDFYSPLVTTDGQLMLRADLAADQVHTNDRGHGLLFQQAQARNIFAVNAPLPVKLLSFRAQPKEKTVELAWVAEGIEPGTSFEVQRSGNGSSYETIATVLPAGSNRFVWTDKHPLAGRNLYRLKITEPARSFYSSIATASMADNLVSITRLYAVNSSTLVAEINSGKRGPVIIRLVNSAGALVKEQKENISGAHVTFNLSVGTLPRGTYFVSVTGADGTRAVRAFEKVQ
jgi:lysophospholipase L1-like esterase